jgi:hypothetical protein
MAGWVAGGVAAGTVCAGSGAGGVLVVELLRGLITRNQPPAITTSRPTSTTRRICRALTVLFMGLLSEAVEGGRTPRTGDKREGAVARALSLGITRTVA